MFDSGISVKNLLSELNTEVDIALDIPDATYVQWLNSLQQLLYTEFIKEQKRVVIVSPTENPIAMDFTSEETNENPPRFEDIHAVYADEIQLIKSTVTSGIIFSYTYFKDNNGIGYRTRTVNEVMEVPGELQIVYFAKPKLIDSENIADDDNVMIPIEFIDLVKAKLRGEAYKLANEDSLSSKWLNDYNVLLETFKLWLSEKASNFGL